MCRKAWQNALGVGTGRMAKICQALQNGCIVPFADQRQFNGSNLLHQQKRNDIDAFFGFLYHWVALPFAEDEAVDDLTNGSLSQMPEWIAGRDGNTLALAGFGLSGALVDIRTMTHMDDEEFYQLYTDWNPVGSSTKAKKSAYMTR